MRGRDSRTNHVVGQLIYLLQREGIEVSQEGGNPLTDSAPVELILSALMMAEHPGDGRWSFHVANSPLASRPGFSADRVRNLVWDRSLAEAVEIDQKDLLGIVEEVAVEAEEEKVCTIKSRKGTEVIEIPIPCANN